MLCGPATEKKKDPRHNMRLPLAPNKLMVMNMADKSEFLAYRIKVVRVGQALSMLGFVALGAHLGDKGTFSDPDVRTPLVVLGLCLAVALATPWKRLLSTVWGEIGMLIWAAALIGGLVVADAVAPDDVLAIGLLAIVVFSAASLVNPLITGAVATMGLISYFLIVQGGSTFRDFSSDDLSRLVVFATAASLLLIAASGLSLIHISEPTRPNAPSRMPSSA